MIELKYAVEWIRKYKEKWDNAPTNEAKVEITRLQHCANSGCISEIGQEMLEYLQNKYQYTYEEPIKTKHCPVCKKDVIEKPSKFEGGSFYYVCNDCLNEGKEAYWKNAKALYNAQNND